MLRLEETGRPRDVALAVSATLKAERQRHPEAGALLATLRDYVCACVLAQPSDVVMRLHCELQINIAHEPEPSIAEMVASEEAEVIPIRRRRIA